jgi:hypothetical protein
MLESVKRELNSTIENMNANLNTVLAKQEYDYMKCYSLYVKKKEREIRELINALS